MNEPTYDDVPYRGSSIPASAPSALALTARVFGGPRPPLSSARVLELGCGDGANLLALAFHHPDWTLSGVDSSARAIAEAKDGARTLGLQNVRFLHADLGALGPALGEHEFVIAHGVYSWIDAEHRTALRSLVRRSLAPAGLAYVSFNAQPAWGVRGRVRDALTRWPAGDLDGARRRAAGLREILSAPAHDWATLLAHELERAAAAPDPYLAHEYLASHNDAFWLGEVVRAFADEGVRYVGDALFDRPEGFVDPELRARVALLAHDPVAREELVDLLAYRQLRAAVLCRDDAPVAPPAGRAIIDEAWVASVVRATSDPFDPSPGVEERFVGPRGTEVRVASSLAKMALLVLASSYPRAHRLDALSAQASALLRDHGVTPRAEEREILRAGLFDLFERIELELRLEDPPLLAEVAERPEACALARYEAASGRHLTSAVHVPLPLEPIEREIVTRLDGSHRAPELTRELTRAIDSGQVALEGAPSGAARIAPLVAERVERTITTLARWGLAR